MKKLQIDPNQNEGEFDFVNRKSHFLRHIEPRLVMNDYLLKEKEANFVEVPADLLGKVVKYWEKQLHDLTYINLNYFRVYAAMCKDDEELKRYIPDSFFYAFIDEYYTNPVRSAYCDDKQFYDMYFADCNRPETVCRKIDGIYLDGEYNQISLQGFIDLCSKEEEVIVKKSMYSYGGRGILFWKKEDGVDKLINYIYDDHIVGKKLERKCMQYVVQKIVRQHKTLADLNKNSVNTIRIITLQHEGQFHALSSVLRLGVDGRVDNCSSGGIVVGITPDGVTKDVAYDKYANKYHVHPNGTYFCGIEVPAYQKCVDLALKLSKRFCSASRMISWDFAIDENGEPVVIEMNISYGELDFHQMCNGPIFGDMTESVLKEVSDNSFTYRLLVNKG